MMFYGVLKLRRLAAGEVCSHQHPLSVADYSHSSHATGAPKQKLAVSFARRE